MEILVQIFQVCIIPLLGILTKYFINFLTAKRNELNIKIENEITKKYTEMIYNTIVKCVLATNQTYVDNIKDTNFDKKAQEEAFNKTFNSVISILNDEVKEYIQQMTGDLTAYLTAEIEAAIKINKTEKLTNQNNLYARKFI